MERFIDANQIRLTSQTFKDEDGEVYIPLSDVKKAIQQTPTAHVKPLAEVCHDYGVVYAELQETKCLVEKKITKAKQAVASDIFEEIHSKLDKEIERYARLEQGSIEQRERMFYEISKQTIVGVRHYIAGLKKKYTEQGDDNQCHTEKSGT